MKGMRNPQIKSLENVIANLYHNETFTGERVRSSIRYIMEHFADRDYLQDSNHCKIIERIYIDNCYRYKSVKGLVQELHIDVKALLEYRRQYVRLFAKQYLCLKEKTKLDLVLLHRALIGDARKGDVDPLSEKRYG